MLLLLSAVPMDEFHHLAGASVVYENISTYRKLNVGFVINRYFRSGAPPVINPLRTRFPRDTVVPGSFAVTLTWTLPNRTTGAFNVTSPVPGDWFLAAHLPKDEGKISVKVKLKNLQNTNMSFRQNPVNPTGRSWSTSCLHV